MDGVLELKGKLQNIYAEHSTYIDKGVRFILAFVAFFMLNREIGYMHVLANPAVALVLAVICAFLPPIFTLLAGVVLTLAHIYTVSLGMLIVTALVFLIMYIFYLRFAPKTAILILIMVTAYIAKVPAAALIGFGLLGTPAYAVPAALGTIAYYLIHQVKKSAAAVQAAKSSSFVNDMMKFARQALSSKEMWLMVIACIICIILVYTIRRAAIAHAWKAASVVGAIAYVIVAVAGDSLLGVKASTGTALAGAVVAVIVGLVLEVIFFAVDYSKCESLQFEDDDYYYYVKAVPKVGVAVPEKTVQQINKRETHPSETEVIDAKELRKKTQKHAQKDAAPKDNVKKESVQKEAAQKEVAQRRPKEAARHAAHEASASKPGQKEAVRHAKKQPGQNGQQPRPRRTADGQQPRPKKAAVKRKPTAAKKLSDADTEHLLLTQSLEKELNLNKDN